MALDVDYEEGSISDSDFRGTEGDEDIYLDRFPDPFKNQQNNYNTPIPNL